MNQRMKNPQQQKLRHLEVARLQKKEELRNHEAKKGFFVGFVIVLARKPQKKKERTFKAQSGWNESASSPPFTSSASTQSHRMIIFKNPLQEVQFWKEH